MTTKEQDFMLPPEVEADVRLSGPTIWRLQKVGRFPAYIKLSARKNAARRSDIVDWKADPQGWAERNAVASREASNGR